MSTNFGYCCINLTLQEKFGITTNRGMIKRTFKSKGQDYAADLALRNLQDLRKILTWNAANDVNVFRMSSSIFPWMSEYEISDLHNYDKILAVCKDIGQYAKETDQRLVFHPGHFNVLASKSESVVRKTIKELNQHSEIMDMMQLSVSKYNLINVHINGVYGDKDSTWLRFVENFVRLNINCQKRLTLENDDKQGQWSVLDLSTRLNQLQLRIKPAVVFDYLHHICHHDEYSEHDALLLAKSTWSEEIRQLCHYSSSRSIEFPEVMKRAHANVIHERINTYGLSLDIELEAKHKELAVQKYLTDYIY